MKIALAYPRPSTKVGWRLPEKIGDHERRILRNKEEQEETEEENKNTNSRGDLPVAAMASFPRHVDVSTYMLAKHSNLPDDRLSRIHIADRQAASQPSPTFANSTSQFQLPLLHLQKSKRRTQPTVSCTQRHQSPALHIANRAASSPGVSTSHRSLSSFEFVYAPPPHSADDTPTLTSSDFTSLQSSSSLLTVEENQPLLHHPSEHRPETCSDSIKDYAAHAKSPVVLRTCESISKGLYRDNSFLTTSLTTPSGGLANHREPLLHPCRECSISVEDVTDILTHSEPESQQLLTRSTSDDLQALLDLHLWPVPLNIHQTYVSWSNFIVQGVV